MTSLEGEIIPNIESAIDFRKPLTKTQIQQIIHATKESIKYVKTDNELIEDIVMYVICKKYKFETREEKDIVRSMVVYNMNEETNPYKDSCMCVVS